VVGRRGVLEVPHGSDRPLLEVTCENGRVTMLPEQIRRLAELASQGNGGAIEVQQHGSVLYFNDGTSKFSVNARGEDIQSPTQEHLW
jgi:hypothetical protein